MKRFSVLFTVILLGISLAACNSTPKEPASASAEPQKTKAAQVEPADSKKASEVQVEKNSKPVSVKEKNKTIEVFVEGSKEMRQAVLTRSNQSGYEFYLLENYGFTAEEPGKDMIYSKYDDSFFVRIEKLDNATDLNKYKTQQMESFKSAGQVTEIEPSTLFHKSFQDANFCFITEAEDSKGLKTSILYVVKTFGNEKFAFTFHMPLKEAAEGITPSFWAMLATLETTEKV